MKFILVRSCLLLLISEIWKKQWRAASRINYQFHFDRHGQWRNNDARSPLRMELSTRKVHLTTRKTRE